MLYYDHARLDGLAKRHETILELTDYFVNRDDHLEFRQAIFEPRPKKFGPADKDTQRPIIVSATGLWGHSSPAFSSVDHGTLRSKSTVERQ